MSKGRTSPAPAGAPTTQPATPAGAPATRTAAPTTGSPAFDKASLGRKLGTLRKAAGLSQRQCAQTLGVTDKAISKWETGAAYPSMESLLGISQLFDIPLSELFAAAEKRRGSITTIVITGGPCAGKTTALERMRADLEKKGYTLLVVPETATELINAGISPSTCASQADFQQHVCMVQLAKEDEFLKAARRMDAPKVLIVCDRGLLDGAAYLTPLEQQTMLRAAGLTRKTALERYDAVFHLETTAKGAEEAYTLDNNAARLEADPEQARAADDATIAAWQGHDHFRIIGNEGGFEQKMATLMHEILQFLGEQDVLAYERVFLVRRPSELKLQKMRGCTRTAISVTYLASPASEKVRIERHETEHGTTYARVVEGAGIGAEETGAEKDAENARCCRLDPVEHISRDAYMRLLDDADPALSTVEKTRYTFSDRERIIEIDLYPFLPYAALTHVELVHEADDARLPRLCTPIREVTGSTAFSDRTFALALAQDRL
jgi:transcriptional regulator with XRE-family HTH domain